MRTFRMAGMGFSGLVGSPFRAALTTLGIVIGVFAVVLLMALGAGVQEEVTGQLDDLGTNLVQVSPGSEESDGGLGGGDAASTLTVGDAERLAGLPSVAAASPSISLVAPAKSPTGPTKGGGAYAFTGVDPSYTQIRSVDLDAGRFVKGTGEVVLDGTSAEKMLGVGPGPTVRSSGRPWR